MPRLDATRQQSKPLKPLKRQRLRLLLALAALPLMLKMLAMKPTNRAATSPDNPDATLRTRFYAAPPAQVRAQVLEAARGLSTYGRPWRVVDEAGASDVIRCEVPVLVFTDDLSITITPHGGSGGGSGASQVDVTSASRVGQGDFGENARHLRQILGALDARMR